MAHLLLQVKYHSCAPELSEKAVPTSRISHSSSVSPKDPFLVSPVLVEGIGDELRVKGDVREAIAVLDSRADHSRPGNTVAQNLAPAAPPLPPALLAHPSWGNTMELTSQAKSGEN